MNRVPLGAALFFALLAATLVTAVLVVRARTPDLVLEEGIRGLRGLPAELDPTGSGGRQEVPIRFFARESDEHALVAIVDSEENIVRTLDADVALAADDRVVYRWDGRTDAGAVAPDGRYRLLVELPSEDREMVWPQRITLGSPAPIPTEEEGG